MNRAGPDLKLLRRARRTLAVQHTAALAVILLIVNFIRLPNKDKASAQALLISLVSLVGAAANIALLKALDLFPLLSR